MSIQSPFSFEHVLVTTCSFLAGRLFKHILNHNQNLPIVETKQTGCKLSMLQVSGKQYEGG